MIGLKTISWNYDQLFSNKLGQLHPLFNLNKTTFRVFIEGPSDLAYFSRLRSLSTGKSKSRSCDLDFLCSNFLSTYPKKTVSIRDKRNTFDSAIFTNWLIQCKKYEAELDSTNELLTKIEALIASRDASQNRCNPKCSILVV